MLPFQNHYRFVLWNAGDSSKPQSATSLWRALTFQHFERSPLRRRSCGPGTVLPYLTKHRNIDELIAKSNWFSTSPSECFFFLFLDVYSIRPSVANTYIYIHILYTYVMLCPPISEFRPFSPARYLYARQLIYFFLTFLIFFFIVC